MVDELEDFSLNSESRTRCRNSIVIPDVSPPGQGRLGLDAPFYQAYMTLSGLKWKAVEDDHPGACGATDKSGDSAAADWLEAGAKVKKESGSNSPVGCPSSPALIASVSPPRGGTPPLLNSDFHYSMPTPPLAMPDSSVGLGPPLGASLLDYPYPAYGISAPTTLVLKNIDNCYHSCLFLRELINAGVLQYGDFDFFYMPFNAKIMRSIGYAFINLTSPALNKSFKEKYMSHVFQYGTKPNYTGIANLQGLHRNIQYYRNHSVMQVPFAICKPLMFRGDECLKLPQPDAENPNPRDCLLPPPLLDGHHPPSKMFFSHRDSAFYAALEKNAGDPAVDEANASS